MNDFLDIFIKKINIFWEKISEKFHIYLKKAVYKGEEYADIGVQKIENEKLKWELKKIYTELGQYIHDTNTGKNITDYSEDENFILLIDKINRVKNLINFKKEK